MWSQAVNEKGIEEERRGKEELCGTAMGRGTEWWVQKKARHKLEYPRIMNFMASHASVSRTEIFSKFVTYNPKF